MKLSLQDIIVLTLADNGGWMFAHQLQQVNTRFGWIGSSGSRRCRELAEAGKHTIKGIEYLIESRQNGKYVEYRVASTKDTKEYFVEADMKRGWIPGERMAALKEKFPDYKVLAIRKSSLK